MSHDQRPGRIRVIDSSKDGRRRADPVAGAPAAVGRAARPAGAAGQLGNAAVAVAVAGDAAPKVRLPLLPIMLFLFACAAGGGAVTFLLR